MSVREMQRFHACCVNLAPVRGFKSHIPLVIHGGTTHAWGKATVMNLPRHLGLPGVLTACCVAMSAAFAQLLPAAESAGWALRLGGVDDFGVVPHREVLNAFR